MVINKPTRCSAPILGMGRDVIKHLIGASGPDCDSLLKFSLILSDVFKTVPIHPAGWHVFVPAFDCDCHIYNQHEFGWGRLAK